MRLVLVICVCVMHIFITRGYYRKDPFIVNRDIYWEERVFESRVKLLKKLAKKKKWNAQNRKKNNIFLFFTLIVCYFSAMCV